MRRLKNFNFNSCYYSRTLFITIIYKIRNSSLPGFTCIPTNMGKLLYFPARLWSFLLPVILGECTTTDTSSLRKTYKHEFSNINYICVLNGDWRFVISDWMECILKYDPPDLALITQFVKLYPSKKDRFLFNLCKWLHCHEK